MNKLLLLCIAILSITTSTPGYSGEGHDAGREWAEKNDVDSCGGNSRSFIEGCQDYLDEKENEQNESDESEEDY